MSQGRCRERIFRHSLMTAFFSQSEEVDGAKQIIRRPQQYISAVTPASEIFQLPLLALPRLPFSLPNSIPPATPSSRHCVTIPAAARKTFHLQSYQIIRLQGAQNPHRRSGLGLLCDLSLIHPSTVSRMGLGCLI
jgi:hypothetical protein